MLIVIKTLIVSELVRDCSDIWHDIQAHSFVWECIELDAANQPLFLENSPRLNSVIEIVLTDVNTQQLSPPKHAFCT